MKSLVKTRKISAKEYSVLSHVVCSHIFQTSLALRSILFYNRVILLVENLYNKIHMTQYIILTVFLIEWSQKNSDRKSWKKHFQCTWRVRWVRVPSHVGAKCKAENEQPITKHLQEERNIQLFRNWLFVFCFVFCAHMEWHPETDPYVWKRSTQIFASSTLNPASQFAFQFCKDKALKCQHMAPKCPISAILRAKLRCEFQSESFRSIALFKG